VDDRQPVAATAAAAACLVNVVQPPPSPPDRRLRHADARPLRQRLCVSVVDIWVGTMVLACTANSCSRTHPLVPALSLCLFFCCLSLCLFFCCKSSFQVIFRCSTTCVG